MAFSTAAFYRQKKEIIDRDLDRLAETARELGARYWIAAADDFDLETVEEMAADYVENFIGAYPIVFESQDGRVRIHDLQRLHANPPSPQQTAPTMRLRGAKSGSPKPLSRVVTQGRGCRMSRTVPT